MMNCTRRPNPPAHVVVAGVIDKASPAVLAAAGGRYVVRTQTIRSLDGPSPQRFVLLAFDSVEKALAWNDSPAVKEITAAQSLDGLTVVHRPGRCG